LSIPKSSTLLGVVRISAGSDSFDVHRSVAMASCTGLVTFNDGSHGFPRNEGFFQDCRMVRREMATEAVLRAQRAALLARAKAAIVNKI